MSQKECRKCKRTLDFSMFSKNSSKFDLLHTQCKSCDKENNENFRNRNKERLKLAFKSWYEKNRLSNIQRVKKYQEENFEKIKKRMSIYRLQNKEVLRKKQKDWRLNNRDKVQNTTGYITQLLGANKDVMPKEIIDLKRLNLQIKRYLRNQK